MSAAGLHERRTAAAAPVPAPGALAAACAGAAAAMALLAVVSIELSRNAGGVASLWLPNGVLIALLLWRRRLEAYAMLAAATVACGLVNLQYAAAPLLAWGLAACNALTIALAYELTRGERVDLQDAELADAAGLWGRCAVIPVTVVAPLAALLLQTADADSHALLFNWWFSDVTSITVLLPCVLLARQGALRQILARHGAGELLWLALGTSILVALALEHADFPFVLISLLPLFAGLRMGLFGAALTGVVAQLTLAAIAYVFGLGPAALRETPYAGMLSVLLAVTPALLVAVLFERRRRVERMKDELIATISHELRTPLTSIRGSIELLLDDPELVSPDAQVLLAVARRNCERLVELVDDIVDLERLDRGQLAVADAPLDLAAVVRESIEVNRAYGARRRIQLELQAPPTALARGDARRLAQVLANLLSNAIKFSPERGVVTTTLAAADDMWRVSVRDHGEGVPEGFRSRLFERFAQADASSTRQVGGSGLGLSIARSLITRMGGRIGHEAPADGGALFWFELPRAPAPAA